MSTKAEDQREMNNSDDKYDPQADQTIVAAAAEPPLIGTVPFRRWMLVPTSCLMQMSLGSYYSWSIFNKPIAKAMGNEQLEQDVAVTFYLVVGCLGIASCIAGQILPRYGPRILSIVGVVLYAVGHLLAALACRTNSVGLLLFGYGVVGGLGIGLAYICPIAVLQRWYSDQAGMAAGISVGSFGAGAMVASFLGKGLLSANPPTTTFIYLAIIHVVCGLFGAVFMRFPASPIAVIVSPPPMEVKDVKDEAQHLAPLQPQSTSSSSSNDRPVSADSPPTKPVSGTQQQQSAAGLLLPRMTIRQIFTSPDFLFVYAIFFLSVMPGLVMLSRMATVVQNVFLESDTTAAWTVAVNGLLNVLGRAGFGALSDRWGRMPLLMFSIFAQVVCISLMLVGLHGGIFALFLAAIWALTGCYGAALGLVPSLLSDCFGPEQVGALYGVALTGWAAAGVFGGIGFTALIKATERRRAPSNHIYDGTLFAMIPIVCLAAAVSVVFARRLRSRRQAHERVAVDQC